MTVLRSSLPQCQVSSHSGVRHFPRQMIFGARETPHVLSVCEHQQVLPMRTNFARFDCCALISSLFYFRSHPGRASRKEPRGVSGTATKTIAISKWMAYVPFRVSVRELHGMNVDVCDGARDRIEGLEDGRYAAAPMSNYALVEALPRLGNEIGVAWVAVLPVGAGSDRIVCRRGIETAQDLHRAKIGLSLEVLELHLFEHIFDMAQLQPKVDYVLLRNRDECATAFINGEIDAVMTPQPFRSQLLTSVADAIPFEADADLPRYGVYAPFVYRRKDWTSVELASIHKIFIEAATDLATLDDADLERKHPSSFEGISRPAAEVRQTLRWPSIAESAKYLASESGAFIDHVRYLTAFRARRFDAERAPESLITGLHR